MPKTLITASIDPDIDGVSCGLAYEAYVRAKNPGMQAIASFQGTPHPEARFVAEKLGLKIPLLSPEDRFDAIILVDASEMRGLPEQVKAENVIEIIDHRMFAEFGAFPHAKFRVEPIGAAATQIAEFFYFDTSVTLSPELAGLLLCGICSNTVNFKADTNTFRDQRMFDWLQTIAGKTYSDLHDQMYDFKSQYVLDNLTEVMQLDAKDAITQFNLDDLMVCYQIETNQPEPLLQRENEIIEMMHALFPGRKYQLMIMQDAANGCTYLISAQAAVRKVLRSTKLGVTSTDRATVLVIPHIIMRKSVLFAALEATK